MPELYDITGKKIWVAGHAGLAGSAICRELKNYDCNVLNVAHADLDLTDQKKTDEWIKEHKPHSIIVAAARVGGIGDNAEFPAEFLYENLAIAQNIIHSACKYKTEKLLFLGSSCIYPKHAAQPINEDALMSGALEPTNEAYAIAKIAGVKLCQFYRRQYGCDFISLMPTNLYGPGDHWNDDRAHVIPMLISRMHEAKINNTKSVTVWGTGKPLREFLYIDDLAKGVLTALTLYSGESPVNIGSGEEISIASLAQAIARVVGFEGQILFDTSKADGTPRKLLDSSRMQVLGWQAKTGLEKGLEAAYQDFLISLPVVYKRA